MKIYTKTGDKGTTALLGGSRVPKNHISIEAYGTVDELNSHIGLIRDQDEVKHLKEEFIGIQNILFVIGASLAAEPGKSKVKIPSLKAVDVEVLEKAIDRFDQVLPAMRHFVLPGGHQLVSYCHIARCVCRRAERQVIALSSVYPVDALVLQYLNRLSDYLFVLSRWAAHVLSVEETPWLPDK